MFLEGAYDVTDGLMTKALNEGDKIPVNQPYGRLPWNYMGAESVVNLADMPDDATDWIFVELSAMPRTTA